MYGRSGSRTSRHAASAIASASPVEPSTIGQRSTPFQMMIGRNAAIRRYPGTAVRACRRVESASVCRIASRTSGGGSRGGSSIRRLTSSAAPAALGSSASARLAVRMASAARPASYEARACHTSSMATRGGARDRGRRRGTPRRSRRSARAVGPQRRIGHEHRGAQRVELGRDPRSGRRVAGEVTVRPASVLWIGDARSAAARRRAARTGSRRGRRRPWGTRPRAGAAARAACSPACRAPARPARSPSSVSMSAVTTLAGASSTTRATPQSST